MVTSKVERQMLSQRRTDAGPDYYMMEGLCNGNAFPEPRSLAEREDSSFELVCSRSALPH